MQYARDHNFQACDGKKELTPSFEGALMFLMSDNGFGMREYDVDVVAKQGEDVLIIVIASTNSKRGLPAKPPSASRIAKLQRALDISEAPKWYRDRKCGKLWTSGETGPRHAPVYGRTADDAPKLVEHAPVPARSAKASTQTSAGSRTRAVRCKLTFSADANDATHTAIPLSKAGETGNAPPPEVIWPYVQPSSRNNER
ncbi:hypothetical protein GGX14DRAFT_398350 [Mycena pura]|uniref:Uncharacterized protein n=1 Tax=Mycena pura TaxID=153505 RepID=A0AAD6V8P1_9AGAR|nr:hypothetical protein GGX14DRAFT_398350 [Mycena pura]